MKNKYFKRMFFTLLGLTSVFTFTGISLNAKSAPIPAQAQNNIEYKEKTITADFSGLGGEYPENFLKDFTPFEDSDIKCDVYRFEEHFSTPVNRVILLPEDYNSPVKFNGEVKPLEGHVSNTTPIKGITRIEIDYYGNGTLRYDTSLDFKHNSHQTLSRDSKNFVIDFKKDCVHNEYPSFFSIETKAGMGNLVIQRLQISYDIDLGYINNETNNSGYNVHRIPATQLNTTNTKYTNYIFNEDYSSYTTEGELTLSQDTWTFDNLTECVNSISLYGNQSHALSINAPGGYNRNDGYVQAFGNYYIKDQTYYEFDLPLRYGKGRGVGRLVLFTKGLNAPGYNGQPLLVLTDDHYATFCEYLNYSVNGVAAFGPRFDAEYIETGYKWSPAHTVGVSGTGTNEGPSQLNPKVTISPGPEAWVKPNEYLSIQVKLEDIDPNCYINYNIFEDANNSFTAYQGGKIKSNGPGIAKLQVSLYTGNKKHVLSNVITIHATNLSELQVKGQPLKTQYYDGELFDPAGLEVNALYEDGSIEHVNNDACKWKNPDYYDEFASIWQTSIICSYKGVGVAYTIPGMHVSSAPEPTSIKIVQTTGQILARNKIKLDVIVTPNHANHRVEWSIEYDKQYVQPAEIDEKGVLYPYDRLCKFAVVVHHMFDYSVMDRVYFEIVNEVKYSAVNQQKDIDNGEYLICTNNYAYDPSFDLGNNVVNLDKGSFQAFNPKSTSKFLITKSLTEGNYYHIKRQDTNRYLGFNSLNDEIITNSISPIDTYIEVLNNKCKIFNHNKSKVFQFNNVERCFGLYPDGSQTPLSLFKKYGTGSDYIACNGFIECYMHMNDYNQDLGYCKKPGYMYYMYAKDAFETLTNSQRLYLSTSQNFKPAWERLNAWARANGETIQLDAEGNINYNANNSNIIMIKDNKQLVAVICIVAISTFAFIGFVFIKNRKRNI